MAPLRVVSLVGRRPPSALAAAGLLIALLAGCGGGSPARPTPAGTPSTPAPAARFTLSGLVAAADGAPLPGALVEITAGIDAGRSAQTGADGRYQLSDISAGSITLRISADGFAPVERLLTISADATSDFALVPLGVATLGRVIDALTGEGVGGVVIAGEALMGAESDPAGRFTLGADAPMDLPRDVLFNRAGIVSRQTAIRVPGPDAIISVIASSFDLTAFDQMFRSPVLRRWADAPPLHIVDRVLAFAGVNASSMEALAAVVPAADRQSIADDLTWALPQLTGGRFEGFASIAVESPEPDTPYAVLRTGRITVARVEGLTAATGFWGYGRWQRAGDTIVAGLVMLDRNFDTSGSAFRRSLRAHELGHALGYNHVTVRTSVMNASARIEPTPYDLDAARLAFSRPPGNRAPDVDPDAFSTNRVVIPVWGPPIR